MDDVVRYILSFLLYGNQSAIEQVRYAPTMPSSSPARITIVGNEMTAPLHYPTCLEPQIEQLPNGRYIIHTDLIYNTFFFLSRAEEVLNTQRDEHDRFLARFSNFSADHWSTPRIDAYSRILLQLLQLPLPPSGFSAIHLTHDIDTLTQYRHLRGAMGGLLRGHIRDVLAASRDLQKDPAYTFPWMIKTDAECTMHNAECDVIYFVKDTSGNGIDYPQYNLKGKDYRATENLLLDSGAQIGIHSSAYASYPLPKGTIHRSHYLACSITRMQQLADAGYTDDYSMGFADQAGFRLQTSRAVRWINPYTLHLSPLTLHPLTIMDCTLSNAQYMHLNEDEAYLRASELIQQVRLYHGELSLLWHNTSFADGSYHNTLYPKLLQCL